MKQIYTTADVIPGTYIRTWGGYEVKVLVSRQGNRLVERVLATGLTCDVRDNQGATYESVEVAK